MSAPQRSIDDDRGTLLAREDLIGNRRAGDRQQGQDRYDHHGLHEVNVGADCGRKRQSLARFRDKAAK